MLSLRPTRLPLCRRSLRCLPRDESGATAIEFALVALPFFALLFAILEGGLVFWANQVLGTAVTDASRELYTGRFQQSVASVPSAQLAGRFKDAVCARIGGLFDCSTLRIDVRTSASFPNGVPDPIVTDPDGTRRLDPNFGVYQHPQASQITVVQASVQYPVLVPLMGANRSNITSNKRLLLSSTAFRTEPF